MSFTKIEPTRLRLCIDNYEDEWVNRAINRVIAHADKGRSRSWIPPFKKLSIERTIVDNHNNLSSKVYWSLRTLDEVWYNTHKFKQLLKSGNEIYLSDKDAWILEWEHKNYD